MTEYELWMIWGTWFAGIATLCAAGISLWIALSARSKHFEVTFFRSGEWLGITVVNKGTAVEVIDSIGFFCNDSYVAMKKCNAWILQPGSSQSDPCIVKIEDLKRTISEKNNDSIRLNTVLTKIIKEDLLYKIFQKPQVFKISVLTDVKCVSKRWILNNKLDSIMENGAYSENYTVKRKYVSGDTTILSDLWIIAVLLCILGFSEQLTENGYVLFLIIIVVALITVYVGTKNGTISFVMMLIEAVIIVMCIDVITVANTVVYFIPMVFFDLIGIIVLFVIFIRAAIY